MRPEEIPGRRALDSAHFALCGTGSEPVLSKVEGTRTGQATLDLSGHGIVTLVSAERLAILRKLGAIPHPDVFQAEQQPALSNPGESRGVDRRSRVQ